MVGSAGDWPIRPRRQHADATTPLLSARLLIVLSICYGLIVAGIGAFGGPVTPVAIVGALIIGGLWAIRGVFSNR